MRIRSQRSDISDVSNISYLDTNRYHMCTMSHPSRRVKLEMSADDGTRQDTGKRMCNTNQVIGPTNMARPNFTRRLSCPAYHISIYIYKYIHIYIYTYIYIYLFMLVRSDELLLWSKHNFATTWKALRCTVVQNGLEWQLVLLFQNFMKDGNVLYMWSIAITSQSVHGAPILWSLWSDFRRYLPREPPLTRVR